MGETVVGMEGYVRWRGERGERGGDGGEGRGGGGGGRGEGGGGGGGGRVGRKGLCNNAGYLREKVMGVREPNKD